MLQKFPETEVINILFLKQKDFYILFDYIYELYMGLEK